MNKKIKGFIRVLSTLICVVMLISIIPSRKVEAGTNSNIQSIEDKIKENEKLQKEYEDKLKDLNAKESSALEKKYYYDKQVQLTKEKITAAEELISQYDALIEEKINEIDGKSDEIDVKFDEFLERFALNYEDGFVNYLVIMLDSDTFTDFLMNTERTADILEYDRKLMDDLENEKVDLEASKKQLEEARASQQEVRTSLQQTKKDFEGQLKNQENYISNIQSDTTKYEQLLEEDKKAIEQLNAELEKALAEAAKDETVQYPVDGKQLIWPLSTKYATVSSPFGWRKLNGRDDYHYGIDIPAPYGSNVYAAQSGTVTYAQWHFSYGNFVVINHGGGYATLYAHNSSLNVSAGQTVKQGDVIAFVGATGTAYGNHCHFEVRKNGAVQNPLNYVAQP